jgi:hypothetical protein
LRADFKKIPDVLAGKYDIKLPPAFDTTPKKGTSGSTKKPEEKPKQAGLF